MNKKLHDGHPPGHFFSFSVFLHRCDAALRATHSWQILLSVDLHTTHVKSRAHPRRVWHGGHNVWILMQGLSDLELHMLDRVEDTETILIKDDTRGSVIMTSILLALVHGLCLVIWVDLAGDKGCGRIYKGSKRVLACLDPSVADRGRQGLVT